MPSKSLYLLVHRSDATHTSYPLYDLGTLWHGRDRETSPLTWWMPATHSFRPAMSLSSPSFSPSSLSIPTDPPSICTARCGATLHIVLTLVPTHVAWCCDHELFAILDHPYAWIGWFFIVGAGTHAAIFLVLDYRSGSLRGLERVLSHRHTILAHLNWVSIFLGFHSFGLYIHNDTLSALGKQTDLIWTALLNQLQRSYPRWSGSSVVPHSALNYLRPPTGTEVGISQGQAMRRVFVVTPV